MRKEDIVYNYKNKLLLMVGIILLVFSFARLGISVHKSIQMEEGNNAAAGELVANFPMYSILNNYNPELFESVTAGGGVWWTSRDVVCNDVDKLCSSSSKWFYGPVHHLIHAPLTLFLKTSTSFFNTLLVLYLATILLTLYIFSKNYFHSYNKIFLIYVVSLTIGQFAFLENIQQRNIELAEFLLIFAALFAIKSNRNMMLGFSLAAAFFAKLLPLIFFPYLLIKKRFIAVGYYCLFVFIIALVTDITLGWSNWAMPGQLSEHGMPTTDKLVSNSIFTEISHQRGSFYTFVLSFFSDITLTRTETVVIYIDNYIGYINFGFIVFCAIVSFISFRSFYLNGKDTFFDFALITSLMLIVFPRINPHYYIFTLFGIYYVLHFMLEERSDYVDMRSLYKGIMLSTYIGILLMLGEFIPFSIIDRIIDQDFPYFHFMSAYGIQGLATFLLWTLLIVIGPRKHVTMVDREAI